MLKKRITQQEELELIKLYKQGWKTKDLCIKYGWSLNNRHGPLDILKFHNIPIRQEQKTHAIKYSINENYFEKIDTKDKAYFLGLIYADGSVHYKKAEMKLSLQEKDKCILDKFSKYINTDKPLRIIKKDNEKWSNIYSFVIENRKVHTDLKNLGVISKKEYLLEFPKNIIPENLMNHFIRGFFDGDGSVFTIKKTNYPYFAFSGTKFFINDLILFLNKTLKLKIKTANKRFKDRDNNAGYNIYWYGKSDCLKFYDYLYKDCGDLYIKRKKEKFEEIVNV